MQDRLPENTAYCFMFRISCLHNADPGIPKTSRCRKDESYEEKKTLYQNDLRHDDRSLISRRNLSC